MSRLERRSSYPALQTSLQTDREHLEHCLVAAGWISLRQLRHCPAPPAPDTAQGPLTAARAERTVSPAVMSLVATRPRPAPGISATLKGSVSADIMRGKAGVRLTVTRSHVDWQRRPHLGQRPARGNYTETVNYCLLSSYFYHFIISSLWWASGG